jgi:hypothetical protein
MLKGSYRSQYWIDKLLARGLAHKRVVFTHQISYQISRDTKATPYYAWTSSYMELSLRQIV